MDMLKPILDIYDVKKDVLLFYLDTPIQLQVQEFEYLDDDNSLYLNDKIYCVDRSTLSLDEIGIIQAIKDDTVTIKVKSKYCVHLDKNNYHIFIKRRKNKQNDRDFYKALLSAL